MTSTTRGIVLMAVAMVLFSAMHGTVRHVSDSIHPFEAAFFRNLFGLVTIAPWFITRGFEPLRTRNLGLHMKRAVLNTVAMLLFFMALGLSPLALVQSLGFTAPLFTTVLAVLFLGERVRARRMTALAAGFIGMLVIIRPGLVPIDLGAICTVVSAAFWAVCIIMIKRMSETDSAVTITTYMVLLMTPLSGIAAAFVWTWPTPVEFGWLFATGVLGTVAQMLMAQALRHAEATVVLPLDFTKLIWGALIGWLFFDELVDLWTWVGAAVIFAGTTYITFREHQLARERAAERESREASG